MLTEKEIIDAAKNYADLNKSEYFSLQYDFARPSQFLVGYWDISFKVFNENGYEIEGPLLVAINQETGKISSMEELIMQNKGSKNVKISNQSIKDLML